MIMEFQCAGESVGGEAVWMNMFLCATTMKDFRGAWAFEACNNFYWSQEFNFFAFYMNAFAFYYGWIKA